ncbi:MAG TPA: hypothetical protein ENH82_09880 [bacterium]|nr:hypothetical protein [bacterium]
MSLKKRNGRQEFLELLFSKDAVTKFMEVNGVRELKEWEIAQAYNIHLPMLSLDAPFGGIDGVTELKDMVGDSTDADNVRQKVNVDYFLDSILSQMPRLNPKHRKLIELLRNGYTPKEIARKLRITRKGVSFILKEFRNECIRKGLVRYRSTKIKCDPWCADISCKRCVFVKQLVLD